MAAYKCCPPFNQNVRKSDSLSPLLLPISYGCCGQYYGSVIDWGCNRCGIWNLELVEPCRLYGVTCVQTWYYVTRYVSDPWYHKLLVSTVFFADSMHQILITYTAYKYLVTDFGIMANIGKNIWSLIVALLLTGLTSLMVQCFLVTRIYRLSKKNRLLTTSSVLLLIIGEFVLHVVFTAKAFTTIGASADLINLSISINAFAATIDVIIAVFLCSLLQQARTGFRRTNAIIKKLVLFSINTGLLTSVCALMALTSIIKWPDNFVSVAFYSCTGRLYCNSLLATLNARQDIRSEFSEDISLSLQGVASNGMATQRNNISIKIDTQREYVGDEYSPASDLKSIHVG